MREPLSGWKGTPNGRYLYMDRYGVELWAQGDGYEVTLDGVAGDIAHPGVSPQIAAEDAARAMVADMAKALGGSVTWGESEGSDG